MPGIEDKPKIAGAICAPLANQPAGSSDNLPILNQPRQPTNLQGLLRFAMEATKSEDAPAGESEFMPMDEERKRWLENAIKSMTVDVIQLLRKQIEILQNIDKCEAEQDNPEYERAIEVILEHVDNIDIACDFHKIGGFMVLHPCLKSKNSKIRAGGCELLAELCQNNPYCQEIVLANEFVPKLIDIIEKDDLNQVIIKALYALSAIVRNSSEGFSQFIQYNGPSIILGSLKRDCEKIITKSTFLLTNLCQSQPDFRGRLVFLECIPTLIGLISNERRPSHEHVLSLLATLVEENATALSECRNPAYNLQQVLQKYIKECGNRDECLEEIQHCRRILYLVFGLN
ncbi:unnamed protein product [Ceutorhynchus assimilis]|uniref:Nucleotide exchange factor Fes1 domain-containing protein n=1 Tax=Ceutorhynchus assimilis TaxID=467358 RepID=A0A9N9MUY0_9CUCU|nr:unnamed protein product [Ceutorhynchus assimilis]